MEKFVIHGGKPLNGDVVIGGAKNAAVAILPATILAADKCTIENLPCISDVMASLQILSELGASIRMISKSTYEIDTTHLNCTEVSNELSRQMRASYYFLGALLGRFGAGQVAMPGGCNLGPRPIDQHLKAFTAMMCTVPVRMLSRFVASSSCMVALIPSFRTRLKQGAIWLAQLLPAAM